MNQNFELQNQAFLPCFKHNRPKKMNLLDANVSLFGHWGKIHRKKMARVFSFVVTH